MSGDDDSSVASPPRVHVSGPGATLRAVKRISTTPAFCPGFLRQPVIEKSDWVR